MFRGIRRGCHVCRHRCLRKLSDLNAGEMPIYEPGLEQLVAKNIQAGRLRFTTDLKQAVEQALVIFLAVGTPPKLDGSPDLSFVESAASFSRGTHEWL